MKILALSGSTRTGSLNTTLIRMVAQALPEHTVTVEADLAAIPFYNADVEAIGVPHAVKRLRQATAESDLLLIATPEYNRTTPGVLMNAIEWLSRPHRNSVLDAKKVLVISASPSPGGGRSSAAHLRTVLSHIGAEVDPAEFALPRAHHALQPGTPQYTETAQHLDAFLRNVLDRLTVAAPWS